MRREENMWKNEEKPGNGCSSNRAERWMAFPRSEGGGRCRGGEESKEQEQWNRAREFNTDNLASLLVK